MRHVTAVVCAGRQLFFLAALRFVRLIVSFTLCFLIVIVYVSGLAFLQLTRYSAVYFTLWFLNVIVNVLVYVLVDVRCVRRRTPKLPPRLLPRRGALLSRLLWQSCSSLSSTQRIRSRT